uniref:Conserved domain protein n=1 Tax=Strongyloides venezuelensis TaxID=75913 RepID=A0A0K0FXD8_STRVS
MYYIEDIENGITPSHAQDYVDVIDKETDILNVTIIENSECTFDCAYKQYIAPSESYFMRDGKLRRRLADRVCLNGEIVKNKVNLLLSQLFTT